MNPDELQALAALAQSLATDAATPEARRLLIASALWHGLERAEGLFAPLRSVTLFSELLAYLALEAAKDPSFGDIQSAEGWVRRFMRDARNEE